VCVCVCVCECACMHASRAPQRIDTSSHARTQACSTSNNTLTFVSTKPLSGSDTLGDFTGVCGGRGIVRVRERVRVRARMSCDLTGFFTQKALRPHSLFSALLAPSLHALCSLALQLHTPIAHSFCCYTGTEVSWDCHGTPFVTSVRTYDLGDAGEAAVFGQQWPLGAAGTAVGTANPNSVNPGVSPFRLIRIAHIQVRVASRCC
jgi:hypothetical protein